MSADPNQISNELNMISDERRAQIVQAMNVLLILYSQIQKDLQNIRYEVRQLPADMYTIDNRGFPGKFFEIKINKGSIAIFAENAFNHQDGTVNIGARFSSKAISTLVSFRKSSDQSLILLSASKQIVQIGIISTPQEGEAFVNHPSFTMLSTENSPYRFECLSDDIWMSHPNGVTLTVTPPINNPALNKPAYNPV